MAGAELPYHGNVARQIPYDDPNRRLNLLTGVTKETEA